MSGRPGDRPWTWLKRGFSTTRWSLVKRAKSTDGKSPEGLEELCRLYWHPLYAFLRGSGNGIAESQDYVQSFMTRMVHGDLLTKPDEERGKFRTYLLTALIRHVASEKRRGRALKRGGGVPGVSFDWSGAESLCLAQEARGSSPEETFRRAFAEGLVNEALERLRRRYEEAGREALFEELLPALEGPLVDGGYAAAAARLGINEGTLRAAVVRMRDRFRGILRAAAATALRMPPGPALDTELRELFG